VSLRLCEKPIFLSDAAETMCGGASMLKSPGEIKKLQQEMGSGFHGHANSKAIPIDPFGQRSDFETSSAIYSCTYEPTTTKCQDNNMEKRKPGMYCTSKMSHVKKIDHNNHTSK